jgi:hypothetical protein
MFSSVNSFSIQKNASPQKVLNTLIDNNTKLNILQLATDRGGGINDNGKFLSTNVIRANISVILFIDSLMLGANCTDVEALNVKTGQITACTFDNYDNTGGTGVIISANGKINLNSNSAYLFANIGKSHNITQIKINFNNCVIDSGVTSLHSMFECFALDSENLISIILSDFPEGFGANATDLSYMFTYFAHFDTKLKNFTLPKFPKNFGAKATDMDGMFYFFTFNTLSYKGTIINWSNTDSFNVKTSKNMFYNFNHGFDGSVLIISCNIKTYNFFTSSDFISEYAGKSKIVSKCIVKFCTNNKFNIPDQYIQLNNRVTKPANLTNDTFVNWYTNSDLSGVPFNFNAPIIDNLILYALFGKNPVPAPTQIKLAKIYAPIVQFSVIKNKKVKFKYFYIYSNKTLKSKIKLIHFNKLGKKLLIIKKDNKKLKLHINVISKKTNLPKKVNINKIEVSKVKVGNLFCLILHNKTYILYKFPTFSKLKNSKFYKWGIYNSTVKNKKITIKLWNKKIHKKI